jgi:ribA/ribD-fused uncharacterized protein
MSSEPITEFKDEFEFLSNFFPSPLLWRGEVYPTAEHLFQAAKTHDPIHKEAIRQARSAGVAKKMGSPEGYRGFKITLRPDWNEIHVPVMERVEWEKYNQNPELGELLLATDKRKLVEGTWWGDTFWGVDLKQDPPIGENWLGRLLMLTRAKLYCRRELRKLAEHLQCGHLISDRNFVREVTL